MAEITPKDCSINFDKYVVPVGPHSWAHQFRGPAQPNGILSNEDPKELRKRARAAEKQIKADKAARKAQRKSDRRRKADREAVRSTLLAVMADTSKGYARIEAARTLNELGMI